MTPLNFSEEPLDAIAVQRGHMIVISVHGVLWSDWGSASRIMEILQKTGNINRLHRTNDREWFDQDGAFAVTQIGNPSLA